MQLSLLYAAALLLAGHAGSHLMRVLFRYGLVGLFLVSIVDSTFVPLPIPGVTDIMLVFYAAGHARLWLLVAIATVGSAIGGYISHAVGHAGGMAFLEKRVPARLLHRITEWVERHSVLAIAVPAILPPPVPLSPFVLVAGAVNVSRRRFMTAFTVSRFFRHVLAVWLGVHYGKGVLRLWSRFSSRWAATILIAFWAMILLFSAVAVWKLVQTSRSLKRSDTTGPAPA